MRSPWHLLSVKVGRTLLEQVLRRGVVWNREKTHVPVESNENNYTRSVVNFFANFNSPVKSSVVILSIEKLDLFKGIYAREVAANLRMHG